MCQLEASGHKAFVVGGAVRDELLGKEPKDWDIATSALPDEIVSIFASADYEVKDIDAASYHVVQVDGIEVATFRRDFYHNGETVHTEPLQNIFQDLQRRDLTINAMAISRHGELIDPFGGKRDLEDGIIDFVGDVHDRILEDPARIIRAARFVSLLNGRFAARTLTALQMKKGLVDDIAHERIRTEILKTMGYKHASKFFYALNDIGALDKILPSLKAIVGFDGGPYHGEDVFTHSMMVGDNLYGEDPILRLTGYLHDVGKSKPNYVKDVIHFYYHHEEGAEMIERDLSALKFTNMEIKAIKNLTLVHMRGGTKMSPKTTRKLLARFAELGVHWEDWLKLKVADRASNLARDPYQTKQVNKLRRKFKHELNPQPRDITGFTRTALEIKDIAMSGTRIQELLGIGPSPLVGVILEYLMNMVLSDPSNNTPEKLEALIMGKKKPVKWTAKEINDTLA
jgi:tRNA nucleotidyltransferase/poly(A) polymerase